MALFVKKTTPTSGIFEAETGSVNPVDAYLYSELAHASTKWPTFDIISSVPLVDPKYWKDSGTAIVEMSQAEKDAVDASEAKELTKKNARSWSNNRYDFTKTFLAEMSEYMIDFKGYDKTTIIDIFSGIGGAIDEMNHLSIEEALSIISGMPIFPSDFDQDVKDKMLAIIQSFLNNE